MIKTNKKFAIPIFIRKAKLYRLVGLFLLIDIAASTLLFLPYASIAIYLNVWETLKTSNTIDFSLSSIVRDCFIIPLAETATDFWFPIVILRSCSAKNNVILFVVPVLFAALHLIGAEHSINSAFRVFIPILIGGFLMTLTFLYRRNGFIDTAIFHCSHNVLSKIFYVVL